MSTSIGMKFGKREYMLIKNNITGDIHPASRWI
jgi:hypothetical protein